MSKCPQNSLPGLIQSFFVQRLQNQRQVSSHTVLSYRDTLGLLLDFTHDKTHRTASEQRLEDWDAAHILQFLNHLETQRQCQPRTRNTRLAAVRSFMRFAAEQEPMAVALASRVLAIPMKRFDRPMVGYLSKPELQAILNAPDPASWNGGRDRVLFSLLYNTGARVSEILAIRRQDLQVGQAWSVQLQGKGRKQRAVPLWKSTATQLQRWLADQPSSPDTRLFRNRFGQPLSRFGVAKRLDLAVLKAAARCPTLENRSVSPHLFRHSTAMHLLQAGVDIAVIALLLGHESPTTTHGYVELDMRMKARCLGKLQAPPTKFRRFRPNDRLLEFLDSL